VSGGAQAALLALMLLLPLSALLARRPPLGATLKMILAWAAIFAVAVMVASQMDSGRGNPGETHAPPTKPRA
jgi:aspartyl protease family protein